MTDDEVEEKFGRLANGEMSPERQSEVLGRLWALETEADLTPLLALLQRSER
jgi:hypothetical protein